MKLRLNRLKRAFNKHYFHKGDLLEVAEQHRLNIVNNMKHLHPAETLRVGETVVVLSRKPYGVNQTELVVLKGEHILQGWAEERIWRNLYRLVETDDE